MVRSSTAGRQLGHIAISRTLVEHIIVVAVESSTIAFCAFVDVTLQHVQSHVHALTHPGVAIGMLADLVQLLHSAYTHAV